MEPTLYFVKNGRLSRLTSQKGDYEITLKQDNGQAGNIFSYTTGLPSIWFGNKYYDKYLVQFYNNAANAALNTGRGVYSYDAKANTLTVTKNAYNNSANFDSEYFLYSKKVDNSRFSVCFHKSSTGEKAIYITDVFKNIVVKTLYDNGVTVGGIDPDEEFQQFIKIAEDKLLLVLNNGRVLVINCCRDNYDTNFSYYYKLDTAGKDYGNLQAVSEVCNNYVFIYGSLGTLVIDLNSDLKSINGEKILTNIKTEFWSKDSVGCSFSKVSKIYGNKFLLLSDNISGSNSNYVYVQTVAFNDNGNLIEPQKTVIGGETTGLRSQKVFFSDVTYNGKIIVVYKDGSKLDETHIITIYDLRTQQLIGTNYNILFDVTSISNISMRGSVMLSSGSQCMEINILDNDIYSKLEAENGTSTSNLWQNIFDVCELQNNNGINGVWWGENFFFYDYDATGKIVNQNTQIEYLRIYNSYSKNITTNIRMGRRLDNGSKFCFYEDRILFYSKIDAQRSLYSFQDISYEDCLTALRYDFNYYSKGLAGQDEDIVTNKTQFTLIDPYSKTEIHKKISENNYSAEFNSATNSLIKEAKKTDMLSTDLKRTFLVKSAENVGSALREDRNIDNTTIDSPVRDTRKYFPYWDEFGNIKQTTLNEDHAVRKYIDPTNGASINSHDFRDYESGMINGAWQYFDTDLGYKVAGDTTSGGQTFIDRVPKSIVNPINFRISQPPLTNLTFDGFRKEGKTYNIPTTTITFIGNVGMVRAGGQRWIVIRECNDVLLTGNVFVDSNLQPSENLVIAIINCPSVIINISSYTENKVNFYIENSKVYFTYNSSNVNQSINVLDLGNGSEVDYGSHAKIKAVRIRPSCKLSTSYAGVILGMYSVLEKGSQAYVLDSTNTFPFDQHMSNHLTSAENGNWSVQGILITPDDEIV